MFREVKPSSSSPYTLMFVCRHTTKTKTIAVAASGPLNDPRAPHPHHHVLVGMRYSFQGLAEEKKREGEESEKKKKKE
jgi:hypothetical protein